MTTQHESLALLIDLAQRVEILETEFEGRGKKFGAIAAALRRDVRQLRQWAEGNPLEGEEGAARSLERFRRQLERIEKRLEQMSGPDERVLRQLEELEGNFRKLRERMEVPAVVEATIPEQSIEIDLERARWKRGEITKGLDWLRGVSKPALTLVLMALAFWVAARLGVLGDVLQHWAQHPLGGGG